MPTIKAFIRTSARKDRVKIRFRLSDGGGIQLFHTSNIEVDPDIWSNKSQEIKPKAICTTKERNQITLDVTSRKSLIREIYEAQQDKTILTSKWLDHEISRRLNPDFQKLSAGNIFDSFAEFIEKKKISDYRKRDFRVVERTLKRFDLYRRAQNKTPLSFHNFTIHTLRDFDYFLHNEYIIYAESPEIFAELPYRRAPDKRGTNTINEILSRLRSFFSWSVYMDKITESPFRKFSIEEGVYGTPYYITIDEREKLYHTNLSRHPQLSIQRDIFVFQCLIGCRVGDLYEMTKKNVINGAIEYVPRKTKDGRPVTVRVPLNKTAQEILHKYQDCGDSLFPFISQQKYNQAIKRVFLAARLRRPVTVINPKTQEPEVRPLNEIASSHLARRTFVGNLYKKVKDPNLVGSLSGHKEGSKAFSRYRDIDEEMKIDLVNLLEK